MKPRVTPRPAATAAKHRKAPHNLWDHYHRDANLETENALVEKYLPLVRIIVARLAMTLPEHVDQNDLHSAGLVGLLHALRNYDPACGTSFETYARLRIRGAMLDELRRMDWVPRTIHEKARRMQDVLSRLEQELGRTPTEDEMARAMNLSAEQYGDLLNEIRPAAFVCLDSTITAEGSEGGSLYDVVANADEDTPMEETSRRELKQLVLARLQQLPEMQRKVLALYYHEDLHLREIAEVFGLTESRICQIHAQAIQSIRAHVQRYESGLAGNVVYGRA